MIQNDKFAAEGSSNPFNLHHYGFQFEKNVRFVGSEEHLLEYKVSELLHSSPRIGIDTESYFTGNEMVVLQIATYDQIFIFDLVSLQSSTLFKETISSVFASEKTIKIGHSLLVGKECSSLCKFFNCQRMNKILDVKEVYLSLFRHENKCSLQYITQRFLYDTISKDEQISNWKQRPLRLAQLHYAAVDAYALLPVTERLLSYFGTEMVTIENFLQNRSFNFI